MEDIVYKGLIEYIKDEKKLVQYLYVLYVLFSKYKKNIYNYLDKINVVDKDIYEILQFFKEEKYQKKDIYRLLQYAIKKTGYNIYQVISSLKENDIKVNGDVIYKRIDNDTGIYIKSADYKIYKRFLLDDVKKSLGL